MGWYITIFTDKRIKDGDVNDIINNKFEAGPAQKFRKSSSRMTSWGWHSNVDVHTPEKNKLVIRGAFYSYGEVTGALRSMADGLERKGYKIIGVDADEGLEDTDIVKSFPKATVDPDGYYDQLLPDDESDKINNLIKGIKIRMDNGEEISHDKILDLYKIAKAKNSEVLMDFVKNLSQQVRENTTTMSRKQLDELIRLITRKILREFMNIDPTSNSDIHSSSSSTAPNVANKIDKNKEADGEDPIKHKQNVQKALKDLEWKRKSKEADNARNQQMVQQYKQVDKPALLKQRNDLKQQLRTV
jgi:hypothetical protein